jgi:hypothetical protein
MTDQKYRFRVRRFEECGRPEKCGLCGLLVTPDSPVGLLPVAMDEDDARIARAQIAHWACIVSPKYADLLERLEVEIVIE